MQLVPLPIEPPLARVAHFLRTLCLPNGDPSPRSTRQRARKFCLIADNLYRRTPQGPRYVPSIPERREYLRLLHDANGHYDAEATYLLLRSRAWWPNMYREVRNYVRACDRCQRRQPFGSELIRNPATAPVSGLWDAISIDFAGPLPRTPDGNRYLIVAVEHLSGWPVAKALPTALSRDVSAFVQNRIIDTYTTPRVILSDNGSQFTSAHTQTFARKMGITWKTVAAFNPQGNGRVERIIRTLKNSLAKTINDRTNLWDVYLPNTLCAYRTRGMWQKPSPYYLMFGTQPRILWTDGDRPPTLRTPEIRPLELAGLHAARDERIHPGTPRPDARFKIGDQVLLARSQNRSRRDRGLALRWDGPYTVADARPPVYALRGPHTRSRQYIHERRLRPYFASTGPADA